MFGREMRSTGGFSRFVGTMAEQNGTEKLPSKRERAAVLVAEDTLSDTEIAELVGIGRTTLHTWKQQDSFKKAVADHAAELERAMLRLAIARKRERLKILDTMQTKMLQVFDARSTQYPGVPGADSGLLVGQLKKVTHLREGQEAADGPMTWTEEQWEYQADVGLMRELRATQEQAAKELGQWSDNVNLTGSLTATVELVGVLAEDV